MLTLLKFAVLALAALIEKVFLTDEIAPKAAARQKYLGRKPSLHSPHQPCWSAHPVSQSDGPALGKAACSE